MPRKFSESQQEKSQNLRNKLSGCSSVQGVRSWNDGFRKNIGMTKVEKSFAATRGE